MVSTTALFIAAPFAIAFFALFARFGFDMKREDRPTQMWGYFFTSIVPFAVVALMWASQEGVDLTGRNIVLGVVGAALGATGLIWGGHLVQGRTKVAEPKPSASEPAQNSIGNISGNSGIITQGQKGDNH
jgi:hypothetical protein